MTIASDYRFRGISQTLGHFAFQGGFDYAHESGVYLGNWNSNVSSAAGYPGASLEMDFYGGYKKAFGDFGVDVGAIYYYYPGSEANLLGAANPHSAKTNSGTVHNFEGYIGGSWDRMPHSRFFLMVVGILMASAIPLSFLTPQIKRTLRRAESGATTAV